MLVKKLAFKDRRLWWAALGLMVIFFSVFITWLLAKNISAPSEKSIQTIVASPPQPKSISSNVLFTGNIFFGRYMNDSSMASSLKYAYPFSRLNEFNRDQYDAWVAGLECPTVPGINVSSSEENATLKFNCSPNYLPEAAKWFTVVTLANNHTDNQGASGFTTTRQQLDKNGIQYFGSYDPNMLSDVCEIISLPVTIKNDDNSTIKGKLPVAMCGYNGVFSVPSVASVAQMRKYSQYMPVIAMPHMGAEYKSAPDQIKIDFYHSLIDGGADMVLGDHPHWIQSTESYKGHLIVYSMGNFIFDQQFSPEVTRSAAIRVVMNSNDNPILLRQWLALGDQCVQFKDKCLDTIKNQNLTKLPINYQFAVIGTNNNSKNRLTIPATGDQQAGILQRLNWQSTMDKLQPPYSSL